MTPVLELQGVSRVHGRGHLRVDALVDASLRVEPGSLVAVMGPSGSGKTTLLSLAGGLERPTSGEVLVEGRSLAQLDMSELAKLRRRKIGYVFQQYNLIEGLTAVENVSLVVVAVTSALVASETRRSREILVSVGADPMDHRKLVAATSSVLALLAGILAVPAGLMPVVALWASQDPGPDRLPLVIPWATIATVVFVVPLVAGLVSGIVTRPPKLGSLLRPAT